MNLPKCCLFLIKINQWTKKFVFLCLKWNEFNISLIACNVYHEARVRSRATLFICFNFVFWISLWRKHSNFAKFNNNFVVDDKNLVFNTFALLIYIYLLFFVINFQQNLMILQTFAVITFFVNIIPYTVNAAKLPCLFVRKLNKIALFAFNKHFKKLWIENITVSFDINTWYRLVKSYSRLLTRSTQHDLLQVFVIFRCNNSDCLFRGQKFVFGHCQRSGAATIHNNYGFWISIVWKPRLDQFYINCTRRNQRRNKRKCFFAKQKVKSFSNFWIRSVFGFRCCCRCHQISRTLDSSTI